MMCLCIQSLKMARECTHPMENETKKRVKKHVAKQGPRTLETSHNCTNWSCCTVDRANCQPQRLSAHTGKVGDPKQKPRTQMALNEHRFWQWYRTVTIYTCNTAWGQKHAHAMWAASATRKTQKLPSHTEGYVKWSNYCG